MNAAAGTLILAEDLARGIREHGAKGYPHEACGAILGVDGASRETRALLPLINRRDDSPRNRFEVDADDFRTAERAAAEQGLELIGWYHSHPDHPAKPSEYDREHAWPWYSYVIVSITQRRAVDMTSWVLDDEPGQFIVQHIEMQGSLQAGGTS